MKSEKDDVGKYKSFVKNTNSAMNSKNEKITTMSGNRAKAKEELIAAKKNFAATTDKLADLSEEMDDLHKSCYFILDNFKLRQDARQAETDALKEATSILS